MTAREANFDGLVGPTHNYSGLSFGNVASIDSAGHPSNPRAAAHQGLDKMRLLAGFGLLQGILPPHERPNVHELRRQGFEGSDATVLRDVAARAPQLLNTMSSAAAMWAANAATVSPSIDTAGGRMHITPANLAFNQHRAIEAPITARLLHRVFASDQHFVVHEPLDAELRDEGAANHTRLAPDHGAPGVELFTYGSGGAVGPRRFPGRQDLGASQAIAVAHGVQTYVLAQQHPAAVDAGVFHNDVIAVGNLTTLLLHEQAYHDQASVLRAVADLLDGELNVIEVTADELPIEEAVASYLFNSQLVSLGDRQLLLAPEEILRHERSAAVAARLAETDEIDELVTMDLHQSMRNGGGPACLRLRVVLTDQEQQAVNPQCWLTDDLADELGRWIDRHYRTELSTGDLADPKLLEESRRALDELTQMLDVGSVYEFQR